MELLPQVKVKEDRKDAREATVFRKLRVARNKEQEEKEIAEIISSVEPEKRKIKADLDRFRNKAEQRKSDLLGEIRALEVKRDRIMDPFYQIKFEAQEMIATAQNYEKRVKLMAKEVNEKSDKVEAQAKLLGEREEMLTKKESDIATRDIESIEESERVATARKQLDHDKAAFETDSLARKNELDAKDSDLKKREAEIESKLEIIEGEKEALKVERAQIADQRKTLERGFQELRSKQ